MSQARSNGSRDRGPNGGLDQLHGLRFGTTPRWLFVFTISLSGLCLQVGKAFVDPFDFIAEGVSFRTQLRDPSFVADVTFTFVTAIVAVSVIAMTTFRGGLTVAGPLVTSVSVVVMFTAGIGIVVIMISVIPVMAT